MFSNPEVGASMKIAAMLTALTDAYSEFRESNRGLPLRRQLYALLYPTPTSGKLHIYTDSCLMFMILLSVIVILLESVAFMEAIFHPEFQLLDAFVVAIFTVEYFVRIYVAPEDPKYASPVVGRLKFIKSYSA
jgi:voltage-gated potassium channel